MVIEQAVEIPTPDGSSDGFLYRPEETGSWPGVIHYTDIGGNRDANRNLSKRISKLGYVVLMPNVFYRVARPPLFDFPRTPGDERTMQRFRELSAPLTPDAMERDAIAYVDFLSSLNSARQGATGVVGYCFTGQIALRTAAVRTNKIMAAASFHGGGLYTEAPTSPHLVLPRVKARLYFGHAEGDRSMPVEAIAKLEDALEAWGGKYESEVYEGAAHAWTMPDAPVYNQPQAERAFVKLAELLAATLK